MDRPGSGPAGHRVAQDVVEEVARTSYGRLVAYLASVSGDLAAAEDALGDALVSALRTWPERGIPDRPDSWLVTAARRALIDDSRRRAVAARNLPHLARLTEDLAAGAHDPPQEQPETLPDRRLHLMFACAHPAIDASMHCPLILQSVLGLDAARIAACFLVPTATMSQRLVRVKAKIRQAGIPFRLPGTPELPDRLGSVLDAVFAGFGTAWDDARGRDPRVRDLGAETLRLAHLLVQLMPGEPEPRGLLSMMLHVRARDGARRRDTGFVPLDQQDTGAWSRELITEAEHQLSLARTARRIGPYQLQAAIQSVHNRRSLTGNTDWQAITSLYQGLIAFSPTLGSYVARAAARRMSVGPAAALADLDELDPTVEVRDYQPYWVVRSACLRDLGRPAEADAARDRALELTRDEEVRAHLRADADA